MKWFEPVIAIIAILLVILPIINKIKNIKKGKIDCGCGCDSCKKKDNCLANFKAFIKEENF